jgi:hypothetical protein
MSQAEVQRFAADLRSNAALQQEIGKITADPLNSVVSVAQRQGYDFTLEEARGHIQAKAQANGKAMSHAELDRIAGGVSPIDAIGQAGSAIGSAGSAIASGATSVGHEIASWF